MTKLSIVIPTYNRSTSLEKTLINIVRQLNSFQSQEIELLISDNSSTDETEVISKRCLESVKKNKFSYIRQEKNIGFDANVDGLVRSAIGEFTWVISDDDVLNHNALETVYEIILKHGNRDVNYAFINYKICQNDSTLYSSYRNNYIKIVDGHSVFSEILMSNTLISSNIFRTVSWTEMNTERFFGSLWIHMLVSRELLRVGKAILVGQPQITMIQMSVEQSRSEKSDPEKNIDLYTRAHFNLCKFVRELNFYGYSKMTVLRLSKYCIDGEIGHIINMKLSLKNNDANRSNNFWNLLVENQMNGLFSLSIKWLLLQIPSNVFRAMKLFKDMLKSVFVHAK